MKCFGNRTHVFLSGYIVEVALDSLSSDFGGAWSRNIRTFRFCTGTRTDISWKFAATGLFNVFTDLRTNFFGTFEATQ